MLKRIKEISELPRNNVVLYHSNIIQNCELSDSTENIYVLEASGNKILKTDRRIIEISSNNYLEMKKYLKPELCNDLKKLYDDEILEVYTIVLLLMDQVTMYNRISDILDDLIDGKLYSSILAEAYVIPKKINPSKSVLDLIGKEEVSISNDILLSEEYSVDKSSKPLNWDNKESIDDICTSNLNEIVAMEEEGNDTIKINTFEDIQEEVSIKEEDIQHKQVTEDTKDSIIKHDLKSLLVKTNLNSATQLIIDNLIDRVSNTEGLLEVLAGILENEIEPNINSTQTNNGNLDEEYGKLGSDAENKEQYPDEPEEITNTYSRDKTIINIVKDKSYLHEAIISKPTSVVPLDIFGSKLYGRKGTNTNVIENNIENIIEYMMCFMPETLNHIESVYNTHLKKEEDI